jgi:hypothetical protein
MTPRIKSPKPPAIDARIRDYVAGITAAETVNLLCEEFGKGRSIITFVKSGTRRDIRSLLTATHLEQLAPEDFGPIQFWGGPPTRRTHFTGTLLTMLCDSVLYDWATKGHYVEMVEGRTDDEEDRLSVSSVPF